MITETHNCDSGYISLVGIQLSGLPDAIQVGDYNLTKKSEFHVSLVNLKQLDGLPNAKRHIEILKEAFVEFEKRNDLTEFELTGEYRLAKRDERVTVVAMVSMENVVKLFSYLNEKSGLALEVQPTHITIYTLQPEAGIGLVSDAQVRSISALIQVPELSNISVVSSS